LTDKHLNQAADVTRVEAQPPPQLPQIGSAPLADLV
jgi:hypothetical protein